MGMRLLPIYWATPPKQADWEALSAARNALGYTEKLMPAPALEGSPGPILAVGKAPSFITPRHALVESTADPRLVDALGYCLGMNDGDVDPTDHMVSMLSEWFEAPVTYVGEEPYESKVRFE
jgi:hypothetical protein